MTSRLMLSIGPTSVRLDVDGQEVALTLESGSRGRESSASYWPHGFTLRQILDVALT